MSVSSTRVQTDEQISSRCRPPGRPYYFRPTDPFLMWIFVEAGVQLTKLSLLKFCKTHAFRWVDQRSPTGGQAVPPRVVVIKGGNLRRWYYRAATVLNAESESYKPFGQESPLMLWCRHEVERQVNQKEFVRRTISAQFLRINEWTSQPHLGGVHDTGLYPRNHLPRP